MTMDPFALRLNDNTTDITTPNNDESSTETVTRLDLDSSNPSTEWQNLVEDVRNENEIIKFHVPTSTPLIDDDLESSSYASYVVPLKVILPVEHVHKTSANDSFERFNYILLKVDDASYHEHISSDTSDILFPVAKKMMGAAEAENNTEPTTNPTVFDSVQLSRDSIQNDDSDTVLVDAQGYRYELGKHYNILDEHGTSVVEFDEIDMIKAEMENKPINHISKRILTDDKPMTTTKPSTTAKPHEQAKSNSSDDRYEGHYAKIFQWLHWHL